LVIAASIAVCWRCILVIIRARNDCPHGTSQPVFVVLKKLAKLNARHGVGTGEDFRYTTTPWRPNGEDEDALMHRYWTE